MPFRALMQKNVVVRPILVYTMPQPAKVAGASDVTRALQAGALKPRIGSRISLDRVADAHVAVEHGVSNA